MRSLSILAALIVPLAAVSAAPARDSAPPPAGRAEPAAPPRDRCAPPSITYAGAGAAARQARTLGDERAANHYLAVSRQVGGCSEPAVLRTGIR